MLYPVPRGSRVYPWVNWSSGTGCSPRRGVTDSTTVLAVGLHMQKLILIILSLVLIGAGCGKQADQLSTAPYSPKTAPDTDSKQSSGSELRALKGEAFCEALLPKSEVTQITTEAITRVSGPSYSIAEGIGSGECYYYGNGRLGEFTEVRLIYRTDTSLTVTLTEESAVMRYKRTYDGNKRNTAEGGETKKLWPEAFMVDIPELSKNAFYVNRPIPSIGWMVEDWLFFADLPSVNTEQLDPGDDAQWQQETFELAKTVNTNFKRY